MASHDWDDLTHYCKRCGEAMERVVDLNLACDPGPNVVAISHLIAQKRMNEIIDASVEKPCDSA